MFAFGYRGTLLHIYFCCQGSSSTRNERQLGLVKAVKDSHCGEGLPDGETVSEIVELRLDGPSKEEEIAYHHASQDSSSHADSSLILGDFGFLCAEKWLARHGRRFRAYKERSDKGVKRGHRKNSEAWCISAQKACRNDLAKRGFTGVDNQLLGVPVNTLILPLSQRQNACKESGVLQQWHKTTVMKTAQNTSLAKALSTGSTDAHAFGRHIPGQIFGPDNGLPNQILMIRLLDGANRGIVNGTPIALVSIQGAKVLPRMVFLRNEDRASKNIQTLKKMKVLIVENLADLDYGGSDPSQEP